MKEFRTEHTEGAERGVNEISGMIVDAAVRVHRELGPGLLESVYEIILSGELLKGNVERLVVGPIPDLKSSPCPP